MDKSGCARLNGFGFTSIASLNCTEMSASALGSTCQWMAPELLEVKQNADNPRTPTPQSDVFALGMVAVEVIKSTLFHTLAIPNLTRSGVHRTATVPRTQRVFGDEEDRERRTSIAASEY